MVFTALSSFNGVGINTSRTFYKQFFFLHFAMSAFFMYLFFIFYFFLFLFISGWDPTVKYLISKE